MGLSDRVAALATRHVHALLVEVPGHRRLRIAVERGVRGRGWQPAVSPADADVLLVCGSPGPRLQAAVDVVWEQMPGPRVRAEVRQDDEVAGVLDGAHADLLDTDRHREDARTRATAGDLLARRGDMDDGDMDDGDMEMSPGGLPLAEGGEDRDGLEMDVLEVHLGPVLAHWPAGLVLRCSLQGDLIVGAEADVLDPPDGSAQPVAPVVHRLDNVVAVLSLAGGAEVAGHARHLRDAALDDGAVAAAGLERLGRTVRRSRLLRWSLHGVGPVSAGQAEELGLPPEVCGDTYDRLLRMVGTTHSSPLRPGGAGAEVLPSLVTGLDLATARLVVASLDVHELRAPRSQPEASHA